MILLAIILMFVLLFWCIYWVWYNTKLDDADKALKILYWAIHILSFTLLGIVVGLII